MEYKYAVDVILGEIDLKDVPIMFREKTSDLLDNFPEKVLQYAQNLKWAEIKSTRDAKEVSGCPFKGSILDSDERSVTKINTAVNAAQVYGEGFVINWTMQDNSVMALTYEDMLAVPLALATWSNYLHQKARSIYEEIYNSDDVISVMKIGWGEDDYDSEGTTI